MTHVVNQIQAYMSGQDKTLNTIAMQTAIDRMKRSLEGQFSSSHKLRDPSTPKLYPSEAGKCERQILYKALGIPGEPMPPDATFKMAAGDLIELALMYVIEHTPGVALIENNKIRDIIIAGLPWRGATDGILIDGAKKRNVEVKSASGVGFRITVSKGVDDNFGYLSQASVYMRTLLETKVITEPETVFVYINRDTMHLWETVVHYDEKLARAADEKFERILEAMSRKKLLPRPYELDAYGVLPLNCRYCSHKHTCWTRPSQVVEFNGTIPEYKIQPTETLSLRLDKKKKPVWTVTEV